jgi:manganese transport protein
MTTHAYVAVSTEIGGPGPSRWSTLKRYLAFSGPGALVAIGYIDPGNWATDIAGGSRFGYSLLCVVVASSLVAILFQTLSARLGIATGRDLAGLCREAWPRGAWPMWLAAEIAIVATDLAEVLGSAVALQLLFGIPLGVGVVLTAVDVGVLLLLERRGLKWLERVVTAIVVLIAISFVYELVLSRPMLGPLLRGLVPPPRLAHDPVMLFTGIGILGATVMPHNLYLHSSLVGPAETECKTVSRGVRVRHAMIDTAVSLGVAMFLNAALLVMAAAVFHLTGHEDIADISDAHRLLAPLLGSRLAPIVFALALLGAGQSATITGTLAGQVVMTGFLGIRWPQWQRRVITRAFAIVPALLFIWAKGDATVSGLLVGSQVVLSVQLPFAMVPLMRFTSDRRRMGRFVNGGSIRAIGWCCVVAVVAANGALLASLVRLP